MNCHATEPGSPNVPFGFGEHTAQLGDGAVPVVRQALHQNRNPVRPVALVDDVLIFSAIFSARRRGECSTSFFRQCSGTGVIDRQPQGKIQLGSAPLRGEGLISRASRKEFAVRIRRPFFALDSQPF